MEEVKIESVIDFLQKLGNTSEGSTRVYRGHSNLEYELLPSLFRKKKLEYIKWFNDPSIFNVEKNLYDEMRSTKPNDFPLGSTFIENLVKMQHYGLPTRLLDFTYNPLVALYFACNEKEEEDGAVFSVDIKDEDIISNVELSLIYSESYNAIKNEKLRLTDINWTNGYTNAAKKMIDKLLSEYRDNKKINNFLQEEREKIPMYEFNHDAKNAYELFKKHIEKMSNLEVEFFKLLNPFVDETGINFRFLKNELCQIFSQYKLEISDIDNLTRDLSRPVFFNPVLNNERIIRQHGILCVFPDRYFGNDFHPFKFEHVYTSVKKLIIPKTHKKDILNELSKLGINMRYLFPELTYQAKYIASKYGF